MSPYEIGSLLGSAIICLVPALATYSIIKRPGAKKKAAICSLIVYAASYFIKSLLMNSGGVLLSDIVVMIVVSTALIIIVIAMPKDIPITEVPPINDTPQIKPLTKVQILIRRMVHNKAFLPCVLLVLICIALSALLYYTTQEVDKLNGTIAINEKTIKSYKSELNSLKRENIKLENQALTDLLELIFYRSTAVIVTEGGARYHQYGCPHLGNSSFWIYNIEAAEQRGYTPCLDCYEY